MRKAIISALTIISFTFSFGQSIDYYEKILMETGGTFTNDIEFYNDNIYMVGNYSGYWGGAIFNPDTGPDTLWGNGTFLAKFNLDGSLAWAKNIGASTFLYSLDIDASGFIYITFYFSGDMTFDSTDYLNMDTFGEDILLAKYDQDGNRIWIRHIGGENEDRVFDVTVSDAGDIYITGSYASTIDFDTTSTIGLTTTSPSNLDAFVAKFNSSGEVQWAQKMGGTAADRGYGISTDANGNVLVAGNFTGTMTTSVGSFTSLGETDAFVAKYDSNGNLLWVRTGGATDGDSGIEAAFDSQGNCILAGYYSGTSTFDSIQINGIYNWDVFIAKYDPDGNILWVRYGGGDGFFVEEPTDIKVDANDDIFLSGLYGGDGYFGSLTMSAGGPGSKMFIIKYTSEGDEVWLDDALSIYDNANGIVLDGNNGVYASGLSSVTTSKYDYYLIKYTDNSGGSPPVAIQEELEKKSEIYPNPFTDFTSITIDGNQAIRYVKVLNMEGRLMKSSFSISGQRVILDGRNLPVGMYFIEIGGENGFLKRDKIIVH